MRKGNLPRLDRVGGDDGGGHDTGDGGTDVGAEGEGEHVLEADETHSREGGEGGGGDGGGLHHDGDEHADDDVQVAVEADNLLKEHDAEEAGAEGDDGEESPAPSSVMSHLSRVRPPLRRRFSQSFLTFAHTL